MPLANIRNALKRTTAKNVLQVVAIFWTLSLIGLLDYLTGREISFGVFYFLPIWLTTWYFSRKMGVLVSLACALVWHVVDVADEVQYSYPLIPYWNAATRLIYFLTFAYLLSRIREQLQQSERQLKRLGSFLPICSSCKKIRDDDGKWREIEDYITGHSDTDFSHGLCPECTKQLYPELSDELLKKMPQTGKQTGA